MFFATLATVPDDLVGPVTAATVLANRIESPPEADELRIAINPPAAAFDPDMTDYRQLRVPIARFRAVYSPAGVRRWTFCGVEVP